MISRRVKGLLVAAFSFLTLTFSNVSVAQEHHNDGETAHEEQVHLEDTEKEGEKKFDANEVIFGHVLDAHEFHFFSWKGADGHDHHATIPLPVILYSPTRGVSTFMSSAFEHGHAEVNGYKLVGNDVVPVDANEKVYDFSLTRNVVQMFIALALLLVLMTGVAKRYKKGHGVTSAPTGFQNAIEPVITFVRDEVAKPNLGHKYAKFMPFLLTVFFFILINNIFGLIPGSANVTGNIAFTLVLGVITLLVVNFSGNKHYWGHIFNPPVPGFVKFIMVPVEILSIFTKAFALIIRLFANMLAGHIIIICLISLIFIFGNISTIAGAGFSPISVGFAAFIYVIEVLVAFIQAFIFTNLTAVFIGQAVEEGHGHGDEHHDAHGHVEDTLAPTEPVII
ncbi:ATP synthase F0 subcomplex A subunit [Cnuella takakiae]|uniref:ATP synthase subunit a n=1 Tax=Cnuella takakiae TaxID=1302690 RepID=A0A1M5J123_9BACT|nr:F0F1 ATP synthase subunit A [Cnuella takakiae]OLY91340.1 ATP synthase F0 subunit A [Cnuella takakiae]SHG34318.1 ATP synthase F0 subcomplex A subunit [Cnuella takakiae]